MRLFACRRLLVALGATTALAGCGNPYALKTSSLNYEAPQQPGSIRFTDPKLYKREALINERRQEIAYLDELLKDSKTQTFSPEIIRELEVISSFSAALGLRFDPAAATNYRRDRETSDIQQEIATLRLQAELDKLKRETELFRKALAEQQAVTDTTLGSTSTATVPDLTSGVSAASAEQLTKAIASLQSSLQTRLDGAKAAPLSSAAVNPLDLFQDRAAYRSLLNSAKNAASLDELHDKDGAALVRLYFSATVLPPTRKYMDTLGVLRMQVQQPDWSYDDTEKVYMDWLGYINTNLNAKVRDTKPVRFSQNGAFVALVGTGDLFDLVAYDYPQPLSGSEGCVGLSFDAAAAFADQSLAGCGRLLLAVPRPYDLIGVGSQDHETGVLEIAAYLARDRAAAVSEMRSARTEIRGDLRGELLDDRCRLNNSSEIAQRKVSNARSQIADIVDMAAHALFVTTALAGVELQARKILNDAEIEPPPVSLRLQELAAVSAEARRLMDDLIALGTRKRIPRNGRLVSCTLATSDFVRPFVPVRFTDSLIRQDTRVAVYEVGPREQVQQLSTTARAAEAIGLAAAVSGQVPTQGLGMDGNIAYARSALGKADARERVPLAVSFAEPRQARLPGTQPEMPAFGWLLGPRVTLNAAKQKLMLEQQLKPYDLSVDLSVPGWWPYLYLEAETAWAPNWRDGSGRTLQASGIPPRRIRVELGTNSADFSALTAILSGASSVRFPTVSALAPATVSACAASTELQIFGDNIWRASTVIVGGRKFEGAAVSVLPDMSGVLVSLNAVKLPAVENERALVTVLTPYGPATKELKVTPPPAGESCDPPKPAEKPPSTAPAIASLSSPELSICIAAPLFVIRGTNLKDLEGVSLGGIEGKAVEASPKNGTVVEARFAEVKRGTLQGLQEADLTLRTKQGPVTSKVKIVAPVSCG